MRAGSSSERSTLRLATVATVFLLLCLGFQSQFVEMSAARWMGLSVVAEGDHRLLISDVEAGGPAARAGLRIGDEFMAIDGKPVQSGADYDECAQKFTRISTHNFEVLRDGESYYVPVSPGRPFPWFTFLINGVAILVYLMIGCLVLFQARDDLRCRVLIFLTFAIAFELALPIPIIGAPKLLSAFFAIYYLLVGLQMGLELHLASFLPDRRTWRGGWSLAPSCYVAGLGLGAVAAITTLAEDLAGASLPLSAAFAESVLIDWAQPLWSIVLLGFLLEASLRYPTTAGRRQAAVVVLGILPWTLWQSYTLASRFVGWPTPELFSDLEVLVVLCFPLSILIAIVRYRMFELHLVLRRGVVYITITLTLVVLFYLVVWGGASVVRAYLDLDSLWIVAGVTLLIGLLFVPLRDALQAIVDRRFFPDRAEVGQRLSALVRELPALGTLPAMAERAVQEIAELFEVEPVTLLVVDPDSDLLLHSASHPSAEMGSGQTLVLPRRDETIDAIAAEKRPVQLEKMSSPRYTLAATLHEMGYELAVPSVSHEQLVGVLLIGSTGVRDRMSPEELELLGLLGLHVATVFENVRLFESATRDSLTGLLRRQAVLDQLKNEMRRAVRFGRPLTVGMADLDNFKDVNDRYGHLTGDVILKRVGRTLRSSLRRTDFVGRFGGEEFLLLLPETDLNRAGVVAEKLRRDIESLEIPQADGTAVRPTISIGLASLPTVEQPGPDGTTVIAEADRALYRAKERGRNRVEPAIGSA